MNGPEENGKKGFELDRIATIRSCYTDKFGIPRQPGLVASATARVEFEDGFGTPESVRGLDAFSHVWVLFVFHRHIGARWRPTVRPPRLGGNRRVGVYATRSTFRPNPVGMSVVRLERVEILRGRAVLHLSGIDFLDKTPVLDIKPYVPYADSIPEALGGFATAAPGKTLSVRFLPEAEKAAGALAEILGAPLVSLILEVLAQDPRPAYAEESGKTGPFGMVLAHCEIKWKMENDEAVVTAVEKTPEFDRQMTQKR